MEPIFRLFDTSVEIPPIKDLIYEFARIKAYIPPTHNNWEKISVEDKLIEKSNNRIIATKLCCNSRDRTVLNQVLKNHEVDWLIRLKMAKGVNRTNNFTNTNLKEYEKIKLNKPKEINPFISPSKEKMFNSASPREIDLFSWRINSEKEIL